MKKIVRVLRYNIRVNYFEVYKKCSPKKNIYRFQSINDY